MKDKNKTKEQLISELIELRQRITKLERSETECISMENLSEVFDALKKISSGDPEVRIDETAEVELIAKLKHMINLTAENIREIVNFSHEVPMGLTELFDVMHKVSKGNKDARVSGSSKIELLELLKHEMNSMIENISREISERIKVEVALEKSEKKYIDLYQNAPDGYHSLGLDGTILHLMWSST